MTLANQVDCLPFGSFERVEGGSDVAGRRYGADVHPQSQTRTRGQLALRLGVERLLYVMLKRGDLLVVIVAYRRFVLRVGTGAGMHLVDEIEVFRVAGNELTHHRADNGDLFPARADLI